MAKTKKITELNTTIPIDLKTKDTTYVIDESVAANAEVTFLIPALEIGPFIAPVKDTNDLCLVFCTNYSLGTLKSNYTFITIKDYYKYCDNKNLIKIGEDSVYEDAVKAKDGGSYFTNDKKVND